MPDRWANDGAAAADYVVVGRDAILCVVGYRIGRELLVAVVRRRRGE